jgi:glycosyltransferase involved in cell wall biosynthesis
MNTSTDEVWLSIITPVLNGEKFIGGCIESVAGQNAPGVEHIIMDGMSTDETVIIARRFAEANPSIRIYSENDGSQSAAMNHGIRLARGGIIGFLNADDYYEANLLSRVAEIFKGLREPSLAVANCNLRDERGKIIAVNRPARLTLLNFMKGREYPWNPSAYFYHKSLHDAAGRYDEKDHYVMDLDFLLRAVQKAHVVHYDEVWGNFRWMAGGKTFHDSQTGLMRKRYDELRRRYSGDLTLIERLHLGMFRLLRSVYHCMKSDPFRKKGNPG